MKKSRIMRYLAAALAAVLITTSTVPAYAEVIEEAATVQEETDTVQLSDDDVHVGVSNEQKVADTTVTEPVTEDSVEDTLLEEDDAANTKEDNIVETDVAEDELEATDEVSEAETEAEEADADDDELFVVSGPVAKVGSDEFDDINSALTAWENAGDGATLTLLADVRTTVTVSVSKGSENAPMILDLNDHGILYKGTGLKSVIKVDNGAYLNITDSAGSKKHYIRTDSDGRATAVYDSKKGANNIEVTGGFIAGGGNATDGSNFDGGGIYNSGTFVLEGGTICANIASSNGGGVYSSGTCKINGGIISNNKASGMGGGVCVGEGTMEISGGVIKNNSAANGGGIGVDSTSTSLLMNDGVITGNHAESGRGGGVYNLNELTITGGEISNNRAKEAGGLFSLKAFTMKGGKITENEAREYGGGVMSYGGTFDFEGGEISDNSAQSGGGVYNVKIFNMTGGRISNNTSNGDGAGVVNTGLAELTMSGGEISGNESDGEGGGIFSYGKITLESGEISDNRSAQHGGGIYSTSSVTMNGGKISSNKSNYAGDGLWINAGSFSMYGGEFTNNQNSAVHRFAGTVSIKGDVYVSTNHDDKTGKDAKKVSTSEASTYIDSYTYIYVDPTPNGIATVTTTSGTVTSYDDFGASVDAWKNAGAGAKLTLLDDVVITETITVSGGTEKNPLILDLNGNGILYEGNKCVIIVESGKHFKLDDTGSQTERYIVMDGDGRGTSVTSTEPSSGDWINVSGGYITGGTATGMDYGTGCILVSNNGKFIMNGGTIAANVDTNSGSTGGIYTLGSVTMNGGSVLKNKGGQGGGVYVSSDGSFVMNGGEISKNYSVNYAGGVYNHGQFTLKGGSINNNESDNGGEQYTGGGGGVLTSSDDDAPGFIMLGGEIKNNKTNKTGGGVLVYRGKFTMYGGEIAGNAVGPNIDSAAIFKNNNATVEFKGGVYASQNSDGTGAILYTGTDSEIFEYVKNRKYVTVNGFHVEPYPIPDMTYTGSAIVPDFKVYNGTSLLSSKTDYTVSVKNNTNAGTANYTVTGKGNFSDKLEGTFVILQKNIADTDIVVADIAPKAVSKSAYKPVPSLTYNKKKLVNNKDFTVTYYKDGTTKVDNPTEAGHYVARVTGKGNYLESSTRDVPFVITSSDQVMVSKLTIAKIPDQPYNGGKAIKPALSVKNGKNIVSGDCYEVKYLNNTDVGTATVTITGKEDKGYIGSKSVTFKITGMAISKATLDDKDAKTKFVYNGQPKEKNIELVYKLNKNDPGTTLTGMPKTTYDGFPSGSSAKRTVDYVISYENNVNAGTATMTVTGVNNWSGSVKKTFKIENLDINSVGDTFKVIVTESSYPYKKAGVKPLPQVMFGDKVLTLGTDYTLSYANNTAVGGTKTPKVKVTGKGNFKGVKEKDFVIDKADLSTFVKTVTAKDVVWANKKGNYKTSVTVTDADGKSLSGKTDYTLKYFKDSEKTQELDNDETVAVGTEIYVQVSATDGPKACYKNSVTVKYRVCANDIGKLKATVKDQIYTGKPVNISKADILWTTGITYNDFDIVPDSYEKNINKGTASVIVEGKGSYGGTKKLTFAIKSRSIK